MKTPIADFLEAYATSRSVRMHMPGHKGSIEGSSHDLTEIVGADSLYSAEGIIAESEASLSEIFGADSFYSTEGSSLSIRAAMRLVTLYAASVERRPLVLAMRNAHKAFLTAAILLDFEVEWLGFGAGLLSSGFTPSALEERLVTGELPVAVYVTSPDYLGGMGDIAAIAEVCHRYGVLLVVDNAHGAYLKFLSPSRHPIDLGADIVLDSAHKTLPALTGSAYLHLSRRLPSFFRESAKDAMALFASTSPSYLILESMDRLNPYLASDFAADLAKKVDRVDSVRARLASIGYSLVGDEPMKLTILAKPYGYTGDELASLLADSGIFVEFFDRDYVTLMPSVATEDSDLERLVSALSSIPRRSPIAEPQPTIPRPLTVLSPREAAMSPYETLPLSECVGRVLCETSVSCPPAVPILVSGELITAELILVFSYYGITSLKVVRDEKTK